MALAPITELPIVLSEIEFVTAVQQLLCHFAPNLLIHSRVERSQDFVELSVVQVAPSEICCARAVGAIAQLTNPGTHATAMVDFIRKAPYSENYMSYQSLAGF